MKKSNIFKLFICLFTFAICLYSFIEKQNQLTSLKIELPKVAKEIDDLKDEIQKIQYEVGLFENPAYLMQLVRQPEFGHLKHPFVEDVLNMPEGIAFFEKQKKEILTH